MAGLISCRWDWCRSSFPTIDALDTHVKHHHIWPMQPVRMADIAFMRRMDYQSLHSTQNTDPSIISGDLIPSVSRNKTPPLVVPHTSTPNKRPENDSNAFDTFTQLSSPPQIHSPKKLPTSPALESLMKRNSHSELSVALETFERTQAHKIYQHIRPPPHQCSPTHRPVSDSSSSSQEVVEHQLTQEGDVGPQPPPLLPSELQIEDELVDAELRWPTDEELVVEDSEQPVPEQSHQGIAPDSARGRNFRHGSLSVPLNNSASPHTSQDSHSGSQPIVLQTQAPYSSQTTGWSSVC